MIRLEIAVRLAFLSDALEWSLVGLLINESTRVSVSLHPPTVLRVVRLTPVAHSANAAVVATRRVDSNVYNTLFFVGTP